MSIQFLFQFFLLFILFTSCASSYNLDIPNKVNFVSYTTNDDLKLFYKYDVLKGKYAKKEQRTGIKIVAVKIENNSDREFTFGDNLLMAYKNGNQVQVVDAETTFKAIKQGSSIYLLYLLLTPLNLTVSETNSDGFQEEQASVPIGLVVGPGLTLGNIIASGSSNRKFKTDLENFNIAGKRIKSGETIFGLVPIKSTSFDALVLQPKIP